MAVVIGTLAVQVAVAQTPQGMTRAFHYKATGDLVVAGEASTRLVRLTDLTESQVAPDTVPTQIDLPGDLVLANGVVVISGWDASLGRGVVHAIRKSGDDYVLGGTMTFDNFVISGVAYDDASEKLYVAESSLGLVLTVDWNAATSLPSTGWLIVLSNQDVSLHPDHTMTFNEGVLSFAHWANAELQPTFDVSLSGSSDVFPPSDSVSEFGGPVLLQGATSVVVRTDPQIAVSLVDFDTQAVLGSATTDSSGEATISVPPLQCGQAISLLKPPATVPDAVRPVMQTLGTPTSIDPGWEIDSLTSPGLGLRAFIGNSTYSLSTAIRATPAGSGASPGYTAILAVGSITEVVPIAGTWVLATESIVTDTGFVFRDDGSAGFGLINLPLPNDPGMAGLNVAFQWWMFDPSGQAFAASEIVNVCIRGSAPGELIDPFEGIGGSSAAAPLAIAEGSLTSSTAVRTPSGQSEALQQWFESLGGKNSYGPLRRVLRSLQK